VVARLAQRHGIEASLTPTPGNGVTAAVVLPASLFADPDVTPGELSAGEGEVPSGVVPAALAAAVTPATDLPPPPAPPLPPSWAPAEPWVDLTGEPAGNGNGEGDGNGYGPDWSGWWEPSPDDLEGAEPVSPLAARPPLSERFQAATPGAREPHSPGPLSEHFQAATPGAREPHPPGAGAPEREGSRQPGGEPTAVHSPYAAAHSSQAGVHSPQAGVHSPQTHNPARSAPVAADDAGPEGLVLARRVPQAHLAPELRRHGGEGTSSRPDGALPDAAEARAALSRYQASRQAAKAVVDDGGADDGVAGPEPPPAAGGWS
jgi:hypothetical protein